MNYTPETPFRATEDDTLIYNLRTLPGKYLRGQPVMTNDLMISIQAHQFPAEIRKHVCNVILQALNKEFPV